MDFFCEAHEKGSLYWDSRRIMQNFQDVENSKKIVSIQDSSEVLINVTQRVTLNKTQIVKLMEMGNVIKGYL